MSSTAIVRLGIIYSTILAQIFDYSTEFDSVELLIALLNVTKGMLLPNP